MTGSIRRHMCALPKEPQGGFALISAMVFLVLVLLLGASLVQQAIQELQTASRAKRETRAFNLAEAGIDYAAWQLYNNPDTALPATWSRTDLDGGAFTVEADYLPGTTDAIALASTGSSQGWTSQVRVVGQFLTGAEQNPVFDHALFSDTDLSLSGNFHITGDVHSNGNADVGGNLTLEGDLSAAGSVRVRGNPDITGQVIENADRLPMPTVDLAYYRSIATEVITGDHTMFGSTVLDGVTFIDGDVHINGDFSGSGVIVVTGDVHINGNATLAGEGGEYAIVTTGSVRVNGNCQIEGWIYAHNVDVAGLFRGNGDAGILGGVVADVIQCNGNLDIAYREPTAELPGASSAPSQFAGVSWRRIR